MKAPRADITQENGWFTGEDKVLEFEVFSVYRPTPLPAQYVMQDVTGWQFRWDLRQQIIGREPFSESGKLMLSKTTDNDIAVVGVYAADRATNTQRVRVVIRDTDTASFKGGDYIQALRRIATEQVVAFGTVKLLRA